MSPARRRIKRIAEWLAIEYPGKYAVRIRVEKMPRDSSGYLGTYSTPYGKRKWALIRIHPAASLSERITTLIHEWAHYVVDPDCNHADKSHGGHTDEFYKQFGRMERKYMEALTKELKPKR